MDTYTRGVRAAVDARDHGRCRRCRRTCTTGSHHHRRPRGMGGANRDQEARLANVVTLCGTGTTGCHGWVETHRDQARATGWLLTAEQDPTAVPTTDLWGVARWYDDHGNTWTEAPP